MDSAGKISETLEKTFPQFINFFSENEIALVLFEVNKNFRNSVIKLKAVNKTHIRECNGLISKNLKTIDEVKFLVKNHADNIFLFKEMIKNNNQTNCFILYRSVTSIILSLFRNLKALDLQKCNLGPKGLLILKVFFSRTQALFHINLAYNNLCDEGVKHLTDTLRRNKSIQTINLECNGISDEGFCYLFNTVIIIHTVLKAVKLALNQVTNEGLKRLTLLLDDNPSFSFAMVDLKYNNIVNDDVIEQKNLEKNRIFI